MDAGDGLHGLQWEDQHGALEHLLVQEAMDRAVNFLVPEAKRGRCGAWDKLGRSEHVDSELCYMKQAVIVLQGEANRFRAAGAEGVSDTGHR